MNKTENIFIESKNIPWENTGKGIERKILAYDKNLMMVKVRFEKGAIGFLHKHLHVQMTYIESGQFEVEVERVKKILKKGDVFYIPSNANHGVVCLEAGVLIDIFNPLREDFLK